MRRLTLSLSAVLLASSVWAQTPAVSYDLNVYTAGATVPSTRVVMASAVTCDLAVFAGGDSVNPTTWWFQPSGLTTWCRVDDAARLANLPTGTYTGAVVAVDANGVRALESSPRWSFTRTVAGPVGPAAATSVRITK